jgi:FKBP-type peptidyl-prolyl cis-trans isomerase
MRVSKVSAAVLLAAGCGYACQSSPKDDAVVRGETATTNETPTAPGPPPPEAKREASGLVTQVLVPGRGERKPDALDTVRVHFTGWNEKGKRVENTRERGEPKTLAVAGVIPGFRQALQLMKVGERRRVWVPDKLGYPGRPGSPRGTMVFDIELVEIVETVHFAPAPEDVRQPPPEAETTKSGLSYRYLEHGEGKKSPRPWDRVTLEYDGWTADGKAFDSSRKLGHPATFDMGDVITGWAEVLPKLVVGDRIRLWVPKELGYDGRHGRPRGPIVFDLALRAIDERPEPPRPPADVAAPPKTATRTPSGLAYLALEKGEGERHPTAESRVEIHYSGWTTDGELFDSSVVRGHPATVPLNRVMPGWTEGLQKMVEGDRFVFWIPEELAYAGKQVGKPGMLVYEIELRKILR